MQHYPMEDFFSFLAFAATVRNILFGAMVVMVALFVAYLIFDR